MLVIPPLPVIPGHDRESMPLDPRMRENDIQCPSFHPLPVIPAKAGIHAPPWIPAFAGMTA